MPDASATSTSNADPAALSSILSLFLQMMKGQEGGQTANPTSKDGGAPGNANIPTQNIKNTVPSADASDKYLSDWYGENQGRTVYDKNGNASTIPAMTPPPSQGGQYGMEASGSYGEPEPGTIRGWINNDKGILNGASFENPLIAQAEQLLQGLQSTPSANANSTLVTPPKGPAAPAAPSTPAEPAYNPANTGAISGMMTAQPSIPSLPQTTVPANDPQAVTNMIGANASQATNNANLSASSGQLSGTQTSGGSMFSRLNNANYLPQQLQHLQSSVTANNMSGGNNPVPVNSPAYASLQTPGGQSMDLGSLDSSGISGASSPALGAGGADYAAGGLDSGLASGGYGATGGAASVGGAAGGMGGMSQAAGIGSSVGALITSLGKMFTPGVPGIPSMPSGVPLSQFRPAVMS